MPPLRLWSYLCPNPALRPFLYRRVQPRTLMTEATFLHIGGIRVIAEDRRRLAQLMVEQWQRNRDAAAAAKPKLFFSANGQSIALFGTDRRFREAINEADLVHADGMSLVHVSRLLFRRPLPERVATTDFFHDVARAAEESGMSFYMLGASEDVNREACAAIGRLYPRLRLAGRRNGFFSEREEPQVVAEIAASGADVLWVGLGRPAQEYFSLRNRDRLQGISWIKTCGGLFDFLSGRASRAPDWMQKAGLEWLYRTLREPRRLAWRYLTTNPYALWRMLRHSHE